MAEIETKVKALRCRIKLCGGGEQSRPEYLPNNIEKQMMQGSQS